MTDANAVPGQGTTFNLPNYVGELFLASPTATPFLSAIGGLNGALPCTATEFTWQGYDLRDAAANKAVVEGADAPAADNRKRFVVKNVVERHQEVVEVSYTKLAAVGQLGADAPALLGNQPVQNELEFQVSAKLKEVARDINSSFINGQMVIPTDNTTPAKTGGILAAIATNIVANGTPTALTADMVDEAVQSIFDNGGIDDPETLTLLVGSKQKRALTKAFMTAGNYREQSRNVGGLNLQTIETDFGTLNVMLDRYIPADTVAIVNLGQCRPRVLEIPGKGHFFLEPLAKTGAAERYQLYGEIGLEYGNEKCHAKITGLA